MSGSIFLLQGETLSEMRREGHVKEAELQALLATYPSLLGGEQMDPLAPRRWLLIRREAGLAGPPSAAADGFAGAAGPARPDPPAAGGDRWSLDHIFLDQDAIPTIVEVKQSRNTQIRREVVGQMLDYAANAVVYLPAERLRLWFEDRCEALGRDPAETFAEAFGAELDPEHLWSMAKTNLQAGRVRLVFVADAIPPELRRIVEFLNGQMDPAEVLAVQISQYVGHDLTTLVPQIIGRTPDAERVKAGAARPSRQWDLDSFEAIADAGVSVVARRLLAWADEHDVGVLWGQGGVYATVGLQAVRRGDAFPLMRIWHTGSIELKLGTLSAHPPFDDERLRLEFLERLNALPSVFIPPEKVDAYPSIKALGLEDDAAFAGFVAAFDWLLRQIPAENP